MKDEVLWYLKQLLPLTYWTIYGDSTGSHFTIWRMWLGRCFSVVDIPLGRLVGEKYPDAIIVDGD